jgi:5-methylthioadenosine/S-adenosylhomocysteine deaminase
MATLEGAKALGCQDQLGSLEIGKKADVVLVNTDQWHVWPTAHSNVYSLLVYEAQAQDVYCTIVNGRMVMQNGYLTNIPEQETKVKANQARLRVWEQAGLA